MTPRFKPEGMLFRSYPAPIGRVVINNISLIVPLHRAAPQKSQMAGRETGGGGGFGMHPLFCGLVAGSVLLANPAFAGDPVFVDGHGHAMVFDTASKL
jgi:hypothetical protein